MALSCRQSTGQEQFLDAFISNWNTCCLTCVVTLESDVLGNICKSWCFALVIALTCADSRSGHTFVNTKLKALGFILITQCFQMHEKQSRNLLVTQKIEEQLFPCCFTT